MAEKPQRKGFLGYTDRLLELVNGIRGLLMIVTALAGGGAAGTLLSGDTARIERLEARADSTDAKVERMERQQMDFFSAQVEADSSLRAVLERRAEDKEKAAAERKAVEKLINLGGAP